MIQGLFCW